MNRAILTLLILSAGLSTAYARPQYKKLFQARYGGKTAKVGCSVCHPVRSKKVRNSFGKALNKAFSKPNVKNPVQFYDALKVAESQKGPDGKTFGEIFKANWPDVTRFEKVAEAERKLQAQRRVEQAKAAAVEVAKLRAKVVGSKVIPFRAQSISGQTVHWMPGKTTIFHIWTYRSDPLQAPYGEVGYLDFLATRLTDQGVAVIGIAIDVPVESRPRERAIADVKKFVATLKPRYELLLDDKLMFLKFGDPRVVGGRLPLTVVVNRQGFVTHYQAGEYGDREMKVLREAVAEE